jgi:hypothetical protein
MIAEMIFFCTCLWFANDSKSLRRSAGPLSFWKQGASQNSNDTDLRLSVLVTMLLRQQCDKSMTEIVAEFLNYLRQRAPTDKFVNSTWPGTNSTIAKNLDFA